MLRFLLTCLLLTITTTRTHAAFVFTLSQSGGNVVVTGSGTLNLTALTLANNASTASPGIVPSFSLLYSGPANSSVAVYSGITSPGSLGSGGQTAASGGSGDLVGVFGFNQQLLVPASYVSGSPLADTSTYNNASFSSLGFTPGTYTYTWGSGMNADSLTITSVVPEPATCIMPGLCVLGLLVFLLRHRLDSMPKPA